MTDGNVAGARAVRMRFLLEARSLDTSGVWQSVLAGPDGTGARLLDLQLRAGPGGAGLRLRVRRAGRLGASAVLPLSPGPHAVDVVWDPATGKGSLVLDGTALSASGAVAGVLDRLLLGASGGRGWRMSPESSCRPRARGAAIRSGGGSLAVGPGTAVQRM